MVVIFTQSPRSQSSPQKDARNIDSLADSINISNSTNSSPDRHPVLPLSQHHQMQLLRQQLEQEQHQTQVHVTTCTLKFDRSTLMMVSGFVCLCYSQRHHRHLCCVVVVVVVVVVVFVVAIVDVTVAVVVFIIIVDAVTVTVRFWYAMTYPSSDQE